MVPPPIEGLSSHHLRHRIVTCVIGLPLRGQAHIAQRLQRYLSFFHGAHTQLFNVNDYLGPCGDDALLEALRDFFEQGGSDSTSEGAAVPGATQEKHAILFTSNALIAAGSPWSAHSKSRRRWMKNALETELHAHLCLVEIQVHETMEHRLMYMERHHLTQEFGALDVLKRHIQDFEQRFVPIQNDGSEDDLAYIKVIDYNKKVITNNMMQTFLGSRVARFLGNVHPYNHTVYLSRCGESEYTAAGKIGGDSPLSPKGWEYASRLAEFADAVVCKGSRNFACVTLRAAEVGSLRHRISASEGGVFAVGRWDDVEHYGEVKEGMKLARFRPEGEEEFRDVPATVAGVIRAVGGRRGVTLILTDATDDEHPVFARLWTSSLQRAKQSVEKIRHPTVQLANGKAWEQMGHREYRNLNEQYAGEYEGLTSADIAQREPREAELRTYDPLGYRYKRGESYLDVIARMDDSIQQLESYQEPVMIVAHLPVLRLLYAYIVGMPREKAPNLDIPSHAVIKVQFDGTSDLKQERYTLGPPPSELSTYKSSFRRLEPSTSIRP